MKKQRIVSALLVLALCVCFLSAAAGATIVSRKYYEEQLAALAPVVDKFTPTAEELAQYQTISVGDKGESVLRLKERLFELGYFTKAPTSDSYTGTTADYIKTFQRINGLEETGVATPETQALFYSDYALKGPNSLGLVEKKPDLEITYCLLISMDSAGSGFQLNIQNNTEQKIDSYEVASVPFAANGLPAEMADSLSDQLQTVYLVDDLDLNPKGKLYSISARVAFVMSSKVNYPSVMAAVTSYTTADGETVNLLSPESVWYRDGRAFPNGPYVEESSAGVTHPTDAERATASKWSLGISCSYIPEVYRNYYEVPEGVYLFYVKKNSPADNAGLKADDILIALGDVLTNCDESLAAAMGRIPKGETVDALYWRNGVFFKTKVTR